MMHGYFIEEQKDGRGENAEMVLIKQVKRGVSTVDGKIAGMFPLKSITGKQLPCLKVVVSNGDPEHRFEIRWSNYYEQTGLNPGKFKLVHVTVGQPVILYQTDTVSGRKVIDQRTGLPMIDFLEMAAKFGSEPIMSEVKNPKQKPKLIGWNFGDQQAYTNNPDDMWETGTFEGAMNQLTERFGHKLAEDIMMLFVGNDLFNSFIDESDESVETMYAAA